MSNDSKTVEVRGFDVRHGDDGELAAITVRTTHRRHHSNGDDSRHEIEFTVTEGAVAELKTIRRRSYTKSTNEELHLHAALPAVIAAEIAVADRLDAIENVIGIAERVEEEAEATELEPADDRRMVADGGTEIEEEAEEFPPEEDLLRRRTTIEGDPDA